MSIYAVGDVQGCLPSLKCLLDQAKFDKNTDVLWFAGDLVNRGPESLQTLRFIKSLGDSAKVVLGNHDLHLLAIALGPHKSRKKDTFKEILKAPDRDELLQWLRQQPLVYRDPDLPYLLVHAGIPPMWSSEEALLYSAEIEKVLRGEKVNKFLKNMYGNTPGSWDPSLKGPDRWRVITNYFTRMRFCNQSGVLELESKEGLDQAPPGFAPWFGLTHKLTVDEKVLFGHWAALEGVTNNPQFIALDTGCVWGRQLSMMRLEDHQWFRCHC